MQENIYFQFLLDLTLKFQRQMVYFLYLIEKTEFIKDFVALKIIN